MLSSCTRAGHWQLLRTSNDSSASFATVVPTLTDPGSSSYTDYLNVVKAPAADLDISPNLMQIMPFGAGSDADTFDLRMYGFDYYNHGSKVKQWLPYLLCDLSLTLSTPVGAGSALPTSSSRFCDTLTINHGAENVHLSGISNAENMPLAVTIDVFGCHYVQFDFDMTGATSGNVMFRWFS